MSLGVFAAVLFAALLHAGWNALIRFGPNKMTGMMILTVVQGSIGVLLVSVLPFPGARVWPWLLASGLLHFLYKLALAYAYERGDLSRVYPIARGTAPLLVLMVSALVLSEQLALAESAGIVVLGFGILLMARGVFLSGESLHLIPFALGSALATAGYSLVDGLGARIAGDVTQYIGWLFVLDAAMFVPACLALRGRGVLSADVRSWLLGTLAAAASLGAYWVAVWAMTQAPIALVTALRETSILFAMLIGWLAFREPMTPGKALAGLLILAGVALTRLQSVIDSALA